MDEIASDFDYDGFARRAREAMAPEKPTAFANRVGLSPTTVSKVLNAGGAAAPRLDIAARVAKGLDCSLDWLVYGKGDGPADEGVIRIPRYDVQLAAGAGAWNDGRRHIEDVPLTRAFLMQQFGRTSANGLAFLSARGGSMEPTISDGGLVLIDQTEIEPYDDVFAFLLGGEARVKRLRRMTDGLMLISDNADYPPEHVKGGELNKLKIIGHVLGVLQRIRG